LFTFWAFILIKIYFSPETLTEKQISLYLGIKITGLEFDDETEKSFHYFSKNKVIRVCNLLK